MQLYLVKIKNMQLYVNSTWSSLLWNENSGSAPLLSNFLADSTTEWFQVLCHVDTHTHTSTHTDAHTELDYSATQGEDVVVSGELEMEEATDACSGSFQCWSPLFGHLHYHHLVLNRPRSPSNDFFPPFSCLLCCRIRKVWQKRKCGVKFGCLTISHSTVRMCGPVLFTSHVNSDKSQQRSIYIFQNMRLIFRSIDPRPSWTYWPVRCDRTLRTRRPLTWSQVGSFLMSDPWHFPLCITSLKCHLGSRCMFFFPLFTFSPLMG